MGGNLTAANDTGALIVTTTGAAQSVTTGAGATTINDTSTGTLTVNAAKLLPAGGILTLSGAGTATVTNLTANLDATGDSGTITVTASGTGQTVTTGSGNISIADSKGALTVNAAALSVGNTLTLTGSAAKTVNGLQGNLVATGAAPISVTAGGRGRNRSQRAPVRTQS
jgi:hypothetical protein